MNKPQYEKETELTAKVKEASAHPYPDLPSPRQEAFSCFCLIFLAFSLTSAAFLAWMYHLIEVVEKPGQVDLYTMVGGYCCQAVGVGLFMCIDRYIYRSGGNSRWFYKFGRPVFTAVAIVFFLSCIPSVLSRFLVGTLIFGYIMNIAIGVVAGFYLYDLGARVSPSMRGIVFGGSYGLSAIAVWLLSLVGNRNILQSHASLLLILVMTAVTIISFPAGRQDAVLCPRASKPDRGLLFLALLTVFLFSMEKNLGFSFPSSDLIDGVNLELSRTLYAIGLICAGLISDRSRKYGAICAFAALVTPFIMLSLSGEPISSTIFWGLDYFFYGFFSVFRILLLSDLAAGDPVSEQTPESSNISLSSSDISIPSSGQHADRENSAFGAESDSSGSSGSREDRAGRKSRAGQEAQESREISEDFCAALRLAPLGLLAGRLGDAFGTLYSMGIGSRMTLLIVITSLLFAMAVFAFFRLYHRKYMPVIIRKQEQPQKTEEEHFEDFSARYQLTVRERSVLRLALQEKTNSEIAQELFISESTVKFHIHNLLQKSECANRIDLYARYRSDL